MSGVVHFCVDCLDRFRSKPSLSIVTFIPIHQNLDLTEFAKKIRPAAQGAISRYSLAVYGDQVGEDSVLRVAKDAAPVLAFFGGTGPAPELLDDN